jgi:hypothetical protein
MLKIIVYSAHDPRCHALEYLMQSPITKKTHR